MSLITNFLKIIFYIRLIPFSLRSTLFSDTIQTEVLLELQYNSFKIPFLVSASLFVQSIDETLLIGMHSGESFNHFDYGCYENLKRYGSCTPAQYNLSLVTAPVYLISGDRDPIAPPKVQNKYLYFFYFQYFMFFELFSRTFRGQRPNWAT